MIQHKFTKIIILLGIIISNLISLINCNNINIVFNTWSGPFEMATEVAYSVLTESNSDDNVLDAVESGCTKCEIEQCDGSVGYGNHPDTNGHVTLDAMIMDGQTVSLLLYFTVKLLYTFYTVVPVLFMELYLYLHFRPKSCRNM